MADDPPQPNGGHLEWSICNKDANTFDIQQLEILPNPPEKGKKLRLMLGGHLKETISQGPFSLCFSILAVILTNIH